MANCILVRPMKTPEVVNGEAWSVLDDYVPRVKEVMPYPKHLGRPTLFVLANEGGLNRATPYNRWGLVDTFVVYKRSRAGKNFTLTANEVKAILHDLEQNEGYLSEESGVVNALREPFKRHGEPPSGATPEKAWFG